MTEEARVRVALSDGSTGTVPAASVQEVLAQGGRVLDGEATSLREERQGTALGMIERAGNIAGAVGLAGVPVIGQGLLAGTGIGRSMLGRAIGTEGGEAFAQGAEDAYTFGLGKNIRKAAIGAIYGKENADKYVREKALEREANEGDYTEGAIVGGMESALATGGAVKAGGLAKYLLGPQVAPEMAGALVQAGLAARAAPAAKIAGQIAQGALITGARGAVENSIVGAATELNEEMFGDAKLSAEKIALAAGKSAIEGFAIGGLLGGATPLVARGFGKAGEAASSARGKVAAMDLGGEGGALRKAQDEALWDATHPTPAWEKERALVKDFEKHEIGGAVRRHTDLGDLPLAEVRKMAPEDFAAKISEGVESSRIALKEYRAKLGATGADVRWGDVTDIIDGARKHLDSSYSSAAGVASKKLDDFAERSYKIAVKPDVPVSADGVRAYKLDPEARIPFEELVKLRQGLADEVRHYTAAPAQAGLGLSKEMLQPALAAVKRLEADTVEAAGKALGDATARDTMRQMMMDHSALSTAERSAKANAARLAGHQAPGLFARMLGIGTGLAVAASGHPVAAVGAGIAAANASEWAKFKGSVTKAAVLGKIADMASAANAVQKGERLIVEAVDGASGARRTPYRSPAATASTRARFDKAVEWLNGTEFDLDGFTRHVETNTRIAGAPKMSQAFAQAVTRTVGELRALMPPTPPQVTPGHKPRPSDVEMQKFVDAFDAAQNPERAMREVAAGSLNPAKTRMLAVVAPQTFATMRDEIEKRTITKMQGPKPPSQSDLTKLHLAFGITLDPSLTPLSLASGRAAFAETGPQAQQGGGGKPRKGNTSSMKEQREPSGADRFDR